MIKIGVAILVLSWVPLLVTGLAHPDANPIGFGLLGMLGTLVGAAVAAVGAIVAGCRGRIGARRLGPPT